MKLLLAFAAHNNLPLVAAKGAGSGRGDFGNSPAPPQSYCASCCSTTEGRASCCNRCSDCWAAYAFWVLLVACAGTGFIAFNTDSGEPRHYQRLLLQVNNLRRERDALSRQLEEMSQMRGQDPHHDQDQKLHAQLQQPRQQRDNYRRRYEQIGRGTDNADAQLGPSMEMTRTILVSSFDGNGFGIQLDADLSISAVRPGSAAEQVGVSVGEVLLRVGNDEVRDREQALGLLRAAAQTDQAELLLHGLGAAASGPLVVRAEEVQVAPSPAAGPRPPSQRVAAIVSRARARRPGPEGATYL